MMSSEPSLSVDLGVLKLRNPIIIASGVLGVSIGLMKRAEEAGAAAITSKTTTLEPRKGHENPVVYELEYGLLNSMGLPNPGAEEMGKILEEAKRIINVPIIASFGASTPDEALKIAELLKHADALELNASCPHVKGLGADLMSDPKAIHDIISEVKASGYKIFLKLSAHGDYLYIARKAYDAGVDGFTAINTLKAMAIDINAKKPVLGGKVGGLSGKAIHPVAVRIVYELRREFPDVPIIGAGGVETWQDAVELLLAGAKAIGIGTVLIKGFHAIGQLLDGIKEYLAMNGYRDINEITGLAHK
jgi:dihydroorotate dehydrogenase (NAD+) catalytic subunit